MLTVKGSKSKINRIYPVLIEAGDNVEFTENFNPQLFLRAAAVL